MYLGLLYSLRFGCTLERHISKAMTKSEIGRAEICLICPPKMMSFFQLPAVKKHNFLWVSQTILALLISLGL